MVRMPGKGTEHSPGKEPNFRRERATNKNRQGTPVQFHDYQGSQNFPTWSVFTVMTSNFETYLALQRIADQGTPLAVKDFVIRTIQSWKEDTFTS
jgi:hypothetical protein